MYNLVWKKDGISTTTSKVIADVFNKPHRTVLGIIDKLECSDQFRQHNFLLSYYVSPQNKKIKCYNITRDGFTILAMGFTGKKALSWKEKYITAFNELEQSLHNNKSLMQQINSAIHILESDKLIASKCGKGLSEWKRIKSAHEIEVSRLIKSAQLTLGFS